MPRLLASVTALVCSLLITEAGLIAQSAASGSATPSAPTHSAAQLKFAVIVSRHGVRSPTGKTDQLNRYSAKPWPEWSAPPGYLTEHGAKLMTLFGAYYRALLANEGLLATEGCADAPHVSILADSDQRTRETGKAMAAGMFPGCKLGVQALAEGTPDPLFHFREATGDRSDTELRKAALAGRIGNNPAGLAEAYRPQLQAMEEVLLGCKTGEPCDAKAESLFDISSSLGPGKSGHEVELRSPLGPAATMAENLLLEYTEGMGLAQVGWGRVDANKVRELIQLHTANVDVVQRPPYIARANSSNMLQHILESMDQAVGGKPVAGALGKPGDRLLVLSGHDGNLAAIAGALNLSWLIDGRLNDYPPGGAIVFEIWKDPAARDYSVRTLYTAETLDQMRDTTPLTLETPPERVPVFIPACGQGDGSCTWKEFQQAIHTAILPGYVR